MKYVYILERAHGDRFYVAVTDDVQARIKVHNAWNVTGAAKYGP